MRSATAAAAPIREPAGYLFWTTRNRIVDRHRRTQARGESELRPERVRRYYSDEDDAIAQILDREASADLLEDALRAARAAEDHVVIAVVIAWLELAQKRMGAPRSREVAVLAEVSHTSVNKALVRFRKYFRSE